MKYKEIHNDKIQLNEAINKGEIETALNIIKQISYDNYSITLEDARNNLLPFHNAVSKGYDSIAKAMLDKFTNYKSLMRSNDSKGLKPMDLAAQSNNNKIGEIIISKVGARDLSDINEGYISTKNHGNTVKFIAEVQSMKYKEIHNDKIQLNEAINKGEIETALNIIKQISYDNYSITLEDARNNLLPFHNAVSKGYDSIAKAMLDKFTNYKSLMRSNDSKGLKPMDLAAQSNNNKIGEIIISKVGARDLSDINEGYISTKNHGNTVKFIAEVQSMKYKEIHNDKIQLNEAINKGEIETALNIIKQISYDNYSITLEDARNNLLPFHNAVSKGYDSIAKAMLDKFTNYKSLMRSNDSKGLKPMDLAAQSNNNKIGEIIISKVGARDLSDINEGYISTKNHGNTVKFIAEVQSMKSMAENFNNLNHLDIETTIDLDLTIAGDQADVI